MKAKPKIQSKLDQIKLSPFANRSLIKSYEKRASPVPPPMPPQPPRALQARFKKLKPDNGRKQ